MNIDKLYINGTDIQDKYGFWLSWRNLSAPKPRTKYEQIEGAHGAIDMTEANGDIFYEMRALDMDCIHPSFEWQKDFDNMLADFHGKDCHIVFGNDPDWYWSGRLTIGNYNSKNHTLSMDANVFPFKFAKGLTHVIAQVTGSKELLLKNDRMPVIPLVTVDAPVSLTIGDATIAVQAGEHKILGFELMPKSTTYITVAGDCNIDISYREGRL